MTPLKGQVAFVTGASSGIGRAAAIALAREGADVAVLGRDRARVDETAAQVSAHGVAALPLVADVCREEEIETAVGRILERFGRIDIQIASAGRGAARGPRAVVQLPLEEWEAIVDINLKGAFLSNRAVLPAMMKQRSGTILNVSSARGGTVATPFAAAYSASKRGLMGLTRALAEEMRPYNVRVLAVLPDATDTPLIAAAPALAPHGKMTPRVVAELMVAMIVQPDDTFWSETRIAPFSGTAPPFSGPRNSG